MSAPYHLLLVEDDAIDAETFRRALAHADSSVPLHVATQAEHALALLRQGCSASGERRRWLVLLDLNLPGMGGLELLRRLRAEPALAAIPVAVMTTSVDERDVRDAFALHAAGYFPKPLEPARLAATVDAIAAYWRASSLP